MSRGVKPYCILELDFRRDPRVCSLSAGELRAYLFGFWCTAVEERREIIRPPFSGRGFIAKSAKVDVRMVASLLDKCAIMQGNPLLISYPDGSVRVCGVRRKHSHLKHWHDEDDRKFASMFAVNIDTKPRPQNGEERRERRGENGKEREEPSLSLPENDPPPPCEEGDGDSRGTEGFADRKRKAQIRITKPEDVKNQIDDIVSRVLRKEA